MTTPLDHPLHIAGSGRTAGTDDDDHVRDLIEQVLLTAPGERVMRPDFGSGVLALVFEPNSGQLAAATQMLAQASLQQYLSQLISVQAVEVRAADNLLVVDVRYVLLADGSSHGATVSLPGSGA
ncbi:MAG: GPW/gp25 family protein [Burkholderiales bacterium]|nr:GPW/gp25 family protein [Burkholderiales bacterium]